MRHYGSLKPYLSWRGLEHPIDWAARFGRQAPLQLEIGFGNGERLVRRARAHPELNLVGIDLSWPSARRALRKLHVQGVDNVLLVQAHAGAALRLLFAPGDISRGESLFPCPWPGERQAHRRLFDRHFWRLLNSRMAPGASFTLVSDHAEFFAWARQRAEGAGFALEAGFCQTGLGTKYERKWRGLGQERFFRLTLTKSESLDLPAWEDKALQFPRLASFSPRDFPLGEHPGDELVVFREMLYDPDARRALLRTVVTEDELMQDFWLEFSWQGGDWSLRPAQGCQVVPTRGVQRALALAAELARAGARE